MILQKALTAVALLGTAQIAAAAIIITGFAPAQWGASDATLGIAGLTIEDFEDVNLAPGLSIGVATVTSGSYGPGGTLPNTFAPVTQDGFGNAFDLGVWDGTRVLVNTGNNQSQPYGSAGNFGAITLQFTQGASMVGFSLQQTEGAIVLFLDGSTVPVTTNLQAAAGLALGGGRNGYILITATGNDSIGSITLNNSPGDGFVIDHLAFATAPVAGVPEPSTFGLVAGALISAACLRLRKATASGRR
ncbi:MAG: hypothetical protein FJW30_03035 [Acidobacteria bacterium]|nr:hypothetical protein [Acidobacteriota bacterium]